VLKLQKDVKRAYDTMDKSKSQIVIFGKQGHAEVIGLVGQTENSAIVISSEKDIAQIDFTKAVYLFSQTTKNKEEFENIITLIREKMLEVGNENFFVTDSICKRMASRTKTLLEFADSVDAVLFVSGKHSSNGTYLYEFCKQHKKETFFISEKSDIDFDLLKGYNKIGISGATSTPMWLMEEIRDYVLAKS
jgi:4-hydroxy-3-methylbut-2-enyl diphosphate reductase